MRTTPSGTNIRQMPSARQESETTGGLERSKADPATVLTRQEQRVALLVSEGATNRETASLLYMSPKTVEVHLTRIYRKLGVRSRTELAREIWLSSELGSLRDGSPVQRTA